MRLLRILLVLLCFPFFVWARSQELDDAACLEESIKSVDWGPIFGTAEAEQKKKALIEINKSPVAKFQAAEGMRMLSAVTGIPTDFEPSSILKGSGKKGDPQEIISIALSAFNTKNAKAPENLRKMVEAKCKQPVPDAKLQAMCVNSFYALQGFTDDLLQHFSQKISQIAASLKPGVQPDWPAMLQGIEPYQPQRDPTLAEQPYLTSADAYRLSGNVYNSKNQLVGMALNISGEDFIAPMDGADPYDRYHMINPYYYAFGEIKASDWNSFWKQKFGGELHLRDKFGNDVPLI